MKNIKDKPDKQEINIINAMVQSNFRQYLISDVGQSTILKILRQVKK